MAGTTFADRVGLATSVLEWYKRAKKELAKKGLRPEYWIEALAASLDALLKEESEQEKRKAALATSTKSLRKLDRQTYRLTAGAIDAAIGAYGKGTPQATTVSRLRSQLHRRKAKKPPAETDSGPGS